MQIIKQAEQLTSYLKWSFGLSIVIAIALFGLYQAPSHLTGIGSDQIEVSSTKLDEKGKVIEITTTVTPQESKTLWDWMTLLGVPLVLTILGSRLQKLEQSKALERSREEALQNYFDWMAELLVDQQLIARAKLLRAKSIDCDEIQKNKAFLDASSDVIRARTLSILRLLKEDGDRKGAVMLFLVETHVISELRLNLRGADLSRANLRCMNLKKAMLNGAQLSRANLEKANLQRTNLNGADLSNAILEQAILVDAKLSKANLRGTQLRKANLRDAILNEAVLEYADLTSAELNPWAKKHGSLLKGANFRKAILQSTHLKGVYLSESENLHPAQVLTSCDWDKAIFSKAKWNKDDECWDIKKTSENRQRIEDIRSSSTTVNWITSKLLQL